MIRPTSVAGICSRLPSFTLDIFPAYAHFRAAHTDMDSNRANSLIETNSRPSSTMCLTPFNPCRRSPRFALSESSAYETGKHDILASAMSDQSTSRFSSVAVTVDLPFSHREFLKILRGSPSEVNRGFIRRYLTKYVDAWLDSGLKKDGSETPSDRSFGSKLNNTEVTDFSDWLRDDLAHLYELFCEENVLSHSYPDGAKHPKLTIVPWKHSAEAEARRLLVALLGSPHALRIAKCRNADCQRYFYLEEGHRKSYKNGLFHLPRCNRRVTALNRTKASRDDSRREVIDLAANLSGNIMESRPKA